MLWVCNPELSLALCRCLEFARQELQSALALVRTKLEQKACEQTERVEGSTKERQRILLQLEDDKAARVHRQHRTTVNKLSEGN